MLFYRRNLVLKSHSLMTVFEIIPCLLLCFMLYTFLVKACMWAAVFHISVPK